MMTPDHFRTVLASLRLSQREVARLLEVDDRLVRRWANGSRPIPLYAERFLAKVLVAKAEMMLERTEPLVSAEKDVVDD